MSEILYFIIRQIKIILLSIEPRRRGLFGGGLFGGRRREEIEIEIDQYGGGGFGGGGYGGGGYGGYGNYGR